MRKYDCRQPVATTNKHSNCVSISNNLVIKLKNQRSKTILRSDETVKNNLIDIGYSNQNITKELINSINRILCILKRLDKKWCKIFLSTFKCKQNAMGHFDARYFYQLPLRPKRLYCGMLSFLGRSM